MTVQNALLSGVTGLICEMDDALVFGSAEKEHDERLHKVLRIMQKCKLTLNGEKSEFTKQFVKFLGHIIDFHGVPNKVKAIHDMPPPASTTELRRFLGMAHRLGKFSQESTDVPAPRHALLRKNAPCSWEQQQKDLFLCVKRLCSSTGNLCFYDRCKPTIVSADASSFGLGCVLMRRQETDNWKPVSFASRALTRAKKRYAQIERGPRRHVGMWTFFRLPNRLKFRNKNKP